MIDNRELQQQQPQNLPKTSPIVMISGWWDNTMPSLSLLAQMRLETLTHTMRTDHYTFMGFSTCPQVAMSTWAGVVESDDSDRELCAQIPRKFLEEACDDNPRRVMQLKRWNCGANAWIKYRLMLTRRAWFKLLYRLIWGREYRRHRLLVLMCQQRKFRLELEYAEITRVPLLVRFWKLPQRMQSYVLKFGID